MANSPYSASLGMVTGGAYRGFSDASARASPAKGDRAESARLTALLAPQPGRTRPRVSVATIRRELLDRLLIVNQRHAAAVLHAFERHYNHHRPHRTLAQAAPLRPSPAAPQPRTTTSDDTTGSAD
jgi:hypothetical protein